MQYLVYSPLQEALKKNQKNPTNSWALLYTDKSSPFPLSISSTGTHKDTIEAAKQKHLNSQGVLFYESNLSSYVIQKKNLFSLSLKPGDFFFLPVHISVVYSKTDIKAAEQYLKSQHHNEMLGWTINSYAIYMLKGFLDIFQYEE